MTHYLRIAVPGVKGVLVTLPFEVILKEEGTVLAHKDPYTTVDMVDVSFVLLPRLEGHVLVTASGAFVVVVSSPQPQMFVHVPLVLHFSAGDTWLLFRIGMSAKEQRHSVSHVLLSWLIPSGTTTLGVIPPVKFSIRIYLLTSFSTELIILTFGFMQSFLLDSGALF